MQATDRFVDIFNEEILNDVISDLHYNDIIRDKNQRRTDRTIGINFRDSAFETDEIVGFQIYAQEINKLKRMYLNFKAIQRGEGIETRKILVYVDEICSPIFDELFKEFDFVERIEYKLDEN